MRRDALERRDAYGRSIDEVMADLVSASYTTANRDVWTTDHGPWTETRSRVVSFVGGKNGEPAGHEVVGPMAEAGVGAWIATLPHE